MVHKHWDIGTQCYQQFKSQRAIPLILWYIWVQRENLLITPLENTDSIRYFLQTPDTGRGEAAVLLTVFIGIASIGHMSEDFITIGTGPKAL